MSVILSNEEYLNLLNKNFVDGAFYACEVLNNYMTEKHTLAEIKKFVYDLSQDVNASRDFVNKDNSRNIIFIRLSSNRFGLWLNTLLCI